MDRKLIIVADDFTGANDTGVQFSKAGLSTNVITNTKNILSDIKHCDVLVIDLESRFDTKEKAFIKCKVLGEQLRDIPVCIYKKLDSTFRGNAGAEIEGLMKGFKLNNALVAAALPGNGRITVNGEVWVHGNRLTETEFSKDPRTPIHNSFIKNIINEQTELKVHEVASNWSDLTVQQGKDAIIAEFNEGNEILVFDGKTEDDLIKVAQVINILDQPILIVGTAGLANHLPKIWNLKPKKLTFVFAGSVSETTRSQVEFAKNNMSVTSIDILGDQILLNGDRLRKQVWNSMSQLIENGETRFIFVTTKTRLDVEKAFDIAKDLNISSEEASEIIAQWVGNLAAKLIQRYQPTGVLLTGGDIAIKTVTSLGGSGIRINSEILPGIPYGLLTGCNIKSIVVTKAGGFGEDKAIQYVIEFLEA